MRVVYKCKCRTWQSYHSGALCMSCLSRVKKVLVGTKHSDGYKLTAVTIWYRGRNHTFFISLPYFNGTPVMSRKTRDMLLQNAGVLSNTTYNQGGVGFRH